MFTGFYFYQNQIPKDEFPRGNLVVEVLDGDTFVIPGKQRVRLMNIDAPDMEHCGGLQAKQCLEELVLGKRVDLEEIIVGQYHRIVAMVYVNDLLVEEEMLSRGLAVFTGVKNAQGEKLKEVYTQVKEAGIGIFGPDCYQLENIKDPDCKIKGNNARDTGKKIYHFPGCSAYSGVIVEKFWGDQWFCTEAEAQKAGFVKSKNCYDKKYKPQ